MIKAAVYSRGVLWFTADLHMKPSVGETIHVPPGMVHSLHDGKFRIAEIIHMLAPSGMRKQNGRSESQSIRIIVSGGP